MNGLEITALIVVASWLGVLSLVLILVIRQVSLLDIQIGESGLSFHPPQEGLSIGAPLPDGVRQVLPDTSEKPVHLLLLSTTCSLCNQLSVALQDQIFHKVEIVVLITGQNDLAQAMSSGWPPNIRAIHNPEAAKIAQLLKVRSIPFVMKLEHGTVVDKDYVRNSTSLLNAFSSSTAVDSNVISVSKEVFDHVT